MEKMQKYARVHYRILNKKINAQSKPDFSIMNNDVIDNDYGGHKTRHMQTSRKQIEDIKRTHHNIFIMHRQMRGHLKDLQRRVDSMSSDAEKLQNLMTSQEKHAETIKNITAEVANFNKLHVSMLELLENMETLENKIDKTVPDFRKEISKLDLDVAQIRSHNSYLKDDQENIRQSMKAVAVSVSNLVDKSNNDHETLERLNSTICKMEGNLNKTNHVFEVRIYLIFNIFAYVHVCLRKFPFIGRLHENRIAESIKSKHGRIANLRRKGQRHWNNAHRARHRSEVEMRKRLDSCAEKDERLAGLQQELPRILRRLRRSLRRVLDRQRSLAPADGRQMRRAAHKHGGHER